MKYALVPLLKIMNTQEANANRRIRDAARFRPTQACILEARQYVWSFVVIAILLFAVDTTSQENPTSIRVVDIDPINPFQILIIRNVSSETLDLSQWQLRIGPQGVIPQFVYVFPKNCPLEANTNLRFFGNILQRDFENRFGTSSCFNERLLIRESRFLYPVEPGGYIELWNNASPRQQVMRFVYPQQVPANKVRITGRVSRQNDVVWLINQSLADADLNGWTLQGCGSGNNHKALSGWIKARKQMRINCGANGIDDNGETLILLDADGKQVHKRNV